MSNIAIILLAMGSYHSSPEQCAKVALAMTDLVIAENLSTNWNHRPAKAITFDEDLSAVRKFNKNCKKRRKK